jgi:Pyruvate/2-oxoglutarate dehydrogenase complex, dihydrolipoamide acyltransferase (E2) component, and related enzymes
MPGRDLDRWQETEAGVWERKLGEGEVVVEDAPAEEAAAEEAYTEGGINATDGAIEAATELGIDIATVAGTGLNGRVTKADVEEAHSLATEG